MALGRQLCARIGAAALLAGAVGLVVSPSAAADSEVTGTYIGNAEATDGSSVVLERQGEVGTGIKQVQVGSDSVLETYCIELEQSIGAEGTRYRESDWSDFFKDSSTAPKVNWILRNSYPALTIGELKAALDDVPAFDDDELQQLDAKTAAAGTQAAIWHYTDGAALADGQNPEIVVDLYDYLTGDANDGATNEPQVKLELSAKNGDDHMTARPGKPFGPVTIHTTSSNPVKVSVESTTDGVHLVNKAGDEVTKLSDGQKFYIDVPADAKTGEATIKAGTVATVQVGRVFRGLENPDETQTLILASTGEARISVQAKFTWKQQAPSTPSPTPSETSPNEAPPPTPVHGKAPVTG